MHDLEDLNRLLYNQLINGCTKYKSGLNCVYHGNV